MTFAQDNTGFEGGGGEEGRVVCRLGEVRGDRFGGMWGSWSDEAKSLNIWNPDVHNADNNELRNRMESAKSVRDWLQKTVHTNQNAVVVVEFKQFESGGI